MPPTSLVLGGVCVCGVEEVGTEDKGCGLMRPGFRVQAISDSSA